MTNIYQTVENFIEAIGHAFTASVRGYKFVRAMQRGVSPDQFEINLKNQHGN